MPFLIIRGLLRHVPLWAYSPASNYITVGSLHFITKLLSVDRHNTHGMTLCCGCEY